jgi:hypothetical protein
MELMVLIDKSGSIFTVSDDKGSFTVVKTIETYVISGDYHCTYDELILVLAEIRLIDELSQT